MRLCVCVVCVCGGGGGGGGVFAPHTYGPRLTRLILTSCRENALAVHTALQLPHTAHKYFFCFSVVYHITSSSLKKGFVSFEYS